MKKFVFIFVLLLLSLFYFLSDHGSAETVISQAAESSTMITPSTSLPTFTSEPSSHSILTAWKNCFQSDFSVISTSAVEAEDTPIENWHLRLPNGEERRVMRIDSDSENATQKKELRFFSVDEEGLPVPIEEGFPIYNPTDSDLQNVLNQGEVFFHQIKRTTAYRNGYVTEVVMENELLKEISAHFQGTILQCDESSHCQCKN